MMLDGKKLSRKILAQIKREIKKTGLRPGLASILVGDDPASVLYISIKERGAKKCGINFKKYLFPIKKLRVTSYELRVTNLIKKLNQDQKIHGILVQLPLPKGFDTDKIIRAIDPKKDVDGFHPKNVKLLRLGKPRFVSPPHAAILALLQEAFRKLRVTSYGLRVTKKAVIIANSKTFAEPLKILLEGKKIKTQIVYSKLRITDYGLRITKNADIVIVAKGKPNFITANMVKKGAIVIDVGTNKVNGKLAGDVDFESVSKKAGAITPVPGGVGPMTVAMLLGNTLLAAKSQTLNSKF